MENKYSKEAISAYKEARAQHKAVRAQFKELGLDDDDELEKVLKQVVTKQKLLIFFVSLSVIVAALIVWAFYGFSLSSAKIAITEFIVIFTSFTAFVKSAVDLYRIEKDNLRAKFETIRSTAKLRNKSDLNVNRRDYEADTGFMGDIKDDIKCLLDFLKYRNGRLVVFIDDLDRCEEEDIVDILRAVILLLNDGPVTCFLAIDSRIVVSVLDKHLKQFSEGNVSGQEYLDKIIQLPVCIRDINEEIIKTYINFLSEGKMLTVKTLLKRITFLKNQKLLGDNLDDWTPSEKYTLDDLMSAVDCLRKIKKLKLPGNMPSVHVLKKNKEKLDNLLLDISGALSIAVQPESTEEPDPINTPAPISTEEPEQEPNPIRSEVDMSEYEGIYKPLLNADELRRVNELSFIIRGNPRSIKRILNVYSLARVCYEYLPGLTFGFSSSKILKFIILLERWPYATSLMIEVINRLNYERDNDGNDLSLVKKRFNNHNRNFDEKVLCKRILKYFGDDTDNYRSLELYCFYDALEHELFRDDAGALRFFLSKDDDIRLFKKCLFHENNGEVLMVRDVGNLKPFAFNLNSMLIDRARKMISIDNIKNKSWN